MWQVATYTRTLTTGLYGYRVLHNTCIATSGFADVPKSKIEPVSMKQLLPKLKDFIEAEAEAEASSSGEEFAEASSGNDNDN